MKPYTRPTMRTGVRVIIGASVMLWAVMFLTALVLVGCAEDKTDWPTVVVSRAPCEVLWPHMPQVVQRADTRETKIAALHRNEAWGHACPAPDKADLRGTTLRGTVE